MNETDLQDLRVAAELLESASWTIRLANVLGKPLEKVLDALPKVAARQVTSATQAALNKAGGVALWTMDEAPGQRSRSRMHTAAAGLTGLVGGAGGIAALPIELPLSTGIIMRSIADIARSEGESLKDAELPGEMLSVFALGGRTSSDDAAESAYFAVRAALAKALDGVAAQIAAKGVAAAEGTAFARLVAVVAARFEVQVLEKAAAQVVPVVGAIAGATINTLFIDHFQQKARGHFIVRRLERQYGAEPVRLAYETVMREPS